jgi:alcohol dehydrogenase (cytochrome c)|tara:strand:+ start:4970 stop:7045 length:2076 start_codon:yes stop_codon:yes gene_type:complete
MLNLKETNNMIKKIKIFFISLLIIIPIHKTGLTESLHNMSNIEIGKIAYEKYCAECHGYKLRGTAHGSNLSDNNFLQKLGKNPDKLYQEIVSTMPPGKIGIIEKKDYLNITNYILNFSDIKEDGIQDWVSFNDPSTIDQPDERQSIFKNKVLENFNNISDKDINYPEENDWTSWRRTPLGHGYSPLKQINKENVKKLRLAWSLTMNDGSNQGTPLISQGIMILTHPGNMVQALNAENGKLIWEYRYTYPKDSMVLGGPTKNIAIYKDKIFMATYDAALIALDIRTGKLLWKTIKANYKDGYTHSSGPIIANGTVISGINGCERYIEDGCFITGHDPNSGKEIWRTSTVALSGDINSASWGDTPDIFKAGSDTWVAGSYDPILNIFYIGTSQAKPWVAASRGMSPNEKALYTNSTLAMNPKTGKILWFFQHIPGETIDMEVGFERILANIGDKKVVLTVGKDGILWKLDRENGKFIDLKETINQNIYKTVNRKKGMVSYRDDILLSKIDTPFSACPGIYGGHNWQAASYDPENNLIVIPLHQLCADMVGRYIEQKEGGGGYGADSRSYKMDNIDGKVGKLVSINIENMNQIWEYEQDAMFLTGALTTAGGLTFIGDLDRKFMAFNTKTGELLWHSVLGSALHGFPVSYAKNGKQYIAVQTGMGVFRALTSSISPEIYQPEGGNAIYVFELQN